MNARGTALVGACGLALVLGTTPANAALVGTTKWTQLSPATHPSARYYSAMTYDGSHNLVLFGGYTDGVGFLSDTWVWDGSTWTNKNPAHHPSARDGAAMTYDSASNSVILFGGEDGTAFADTWSWSGIDWTQLTPAQSPPKRAWAGMAASPTTSAPILFGGLDSAGLVDTWTWENANNKWSAVTTAHHPTARSDFGMTLDTVHSEIVVFGGGNWSGTTLNTEYGDTWTFNGTDWTQEHSAYFRAIRLEKTMMTVILLLIVAVAAFNIIASLVMVVSEKRNDIAILRTLGFSRGGVVATFIVQGTLIGWIGALAGTGLGILLAVYAGDIVHAFERWFGFELFDPAVYYISRIPSELRASDVALVSITAFTLTFLATIYPARRAAATEPAAALRYE